MLHLLHYAKCYTKEMDATLRKMNFRLIETYREINIILSDANCMEGLIDLSVKCKFIRFQHFEYMSFHACHIKHGH